jgi:hypothetical protein
VLVLGGDLVADSFVFGAHESGSLVAVAGQRVQVLVVTAFLLFLLNLQGPDVLLELSLVNSVLVFSIFEFNLCLLFEFS